MRRKNICFSLFVLGLIATVTALLVWGVYSRLSRPPITQALDPDRPMVALTFDDGPSLRYTPQILDILYQTQTPATFFLVGERMEGGRLLIREMKAAGHQVECHTYSHQNLSTLTGEEIRQEVALAQEELEKILPGHKFRYLRPPYGSYTQKVEQEAGITLAMWTVDSRDSEPGQEDKIYSNVVDHIKDGDVVVLHDCPETARVLESIILTLKEKGFQLVTLDQLAARLTPEEKEALIIPSTWKGKS